MRLPSYFFINVYSQIRNLKYLQQNIIITLFYLFDSTLNYIFATIITRWFSAKQFDNHIYITVPFYLSHVLHVQQWIHLCHQNTYILMEPRWTLLRKSFTYIICKTEPSTDPCRTPIGISLKSYFSFWQTTVCFLPLTYDVNHNNAVLQMPYYFNVLWWIVW